MGAYFFMEVLHYSDQSRASEGNFLHTIELNNELTFLKEKQNESKSYRERNR